MGDANRTMAPPSLMNRLNNPASSSASLRAAAVAAATTDDVPSKVTFVKADGGGMGGRWRKVMTLLKVSGVGRAAIAEEDESVAWRASLDATAEAAAISLRRPPPHNMCIAHLSGDWPMRGCAVPPRQVGRPVERARACNALRAQEPGVGQRTLV